MDNPAIIEPTQYRWQLLVDLDLEVEPVDQPLSSRTFLQAKTPVG